jgi:hypothetical protein
LTPLRLATSMTSAAVPFGPHDDCARTQLISLATGMTTSTTTTRTLPTRYTNSVDDDSFDVITDE